MRDGKQENQTNAVHMNVQRGSYFEMTLPWTVNDNGYVTKINGQLLHVDASSSLNVSQCVYILLKLCKYSLSLNLQFSDLGRENLVIFIASNTQFYHLTPIFQININFSQFTCVVDDCNLDMGNSFFKVNMWTVENQNNI